MKRFFTLFLTVCLLLVAVPFAGAEENNEKASIPVPNERIVSILEENNIDFQISDGNLKLADTSSEFLAEVNKLLISEFKISQDTTASITAAAYPGPYTHMRN